MAANDADLAKSFLDLAHERGVSVPPGAGAKRGGSGRPRPDRARPLAQSFARGFVSGEPDDLVGFAGNGWLGDLFVFGDIRDAVREGTRLASGQNVDELILGLSCVGLAMTAGTYATLGGGAPARVGLSVVKAARKTGRIGLAMANGSGVHVREVVDWSSLRRAVGAFRSPSLRSAVRAARQAVKVEKAGGLLNVVDDVGRVQSKAGTKRRARRPQDGRRAARRGAGRETCREEGRQDAGDHQTLGRGAIVLTVASFNLTMWMFWAMFAIFGFVSSLKSLVERLTGAQCSAARSTGASQASAPGNGGPAGLTHGPKSVVCRGAYGSC